MAEEHQSLFRHLHDILSRGEDPAAQSQQIWNTYGTTVAVLVLDSSGFTRVAESHGILHFLSRLAVMRNVVEVVMGSYDYRLFRFEADNVFAAFDSPDDAIRAALDIHAALEAAGVMLTEDEPFQVCVGIGYGNLLHSHTLEGYFGEEMNFASKLGEDTAAGGETLITVRAYEGASPELRGGFEKCSVDIAHVTVDYYRHRSRG